uniref:Uncharacterized protein n=1 Tax=Oryza nivara TaxID=4536 RepID=A0A0E0GQ25_ORYNI
MPLSTSSAGTTGPIILFIISKASGFTSDGCRSSLPSRLPTTSPLFPTSIFSRRRRPTIT